MHTVTSKLATRASTIAETLGLAGIAVAVGGITGNPWWGLLTGSVAVVASSVASGRT